VTKKIPIDDAMVGRALTMMKSQWWGFGAPSEQSSPNTTRYVTQESTDRHKVVQLLDAALNPPDEPEIVVTEEMLAVAGAFRVGGRDGVSDRITADIYRAMRKLEPIQGKSIVSPFSFGGWLHARRADDVKAVGFMRTHRRKDDPK